MNEKLMQAIVVRESGKKGDWNTLALEEVPLPQIVQGEVLVQVEAFSVNRADLLQRRGLYPPPAGASTLMGLDFAGFVVQTAPDVTDWSIGDRVFGILAGGGYGRFAAVPSVHLVPVPEQLSFVEAAAVAEVFFTAFTNLFLVGGMEKGERLLIHGGASGVGTAAIQLAREHGIETIISASTPEKIARCLELGAAFGINYKEEDTFPRVREYTNGEGVDVVLDWMGASHLAGNLDVLRSKGRLIVIGLMGGNKGEIVMAPLLSKRLRIIGSILRSQSLEEKAVITTHFRHRVLPLLESGKVRPVIDRIFAVDAVEEAHEFMKQGRHIGKILLSWN
ncbi:MAG: NAD(P)H-quinone oxidoreductase [Deltaproteobacteria bacterium]|nr:NAD(P)H-quinone oxidoreductase [Deltaproteobacteria bacterium]